MIKIVFFAPYPEMIPIIKQVFEDRPDKDELEYEIIQDFFNNPIDFINADVAIARGFTAHTMQSKGIVCAELKVSGYDVLAAIQKCIKNRSHRRIGLVGAFNMVYGAEQASIIYPDIEILTYPLVDETRLEEYVLKAAQDGCTALIGGYTTTLIAGKHGIPCVMIETGRDSVNNAIAEARQVAEISIREKTRSNEIANIMNYSFQGIISADSRGVIAYANTHCHTLLRDINTSLIGLWIKDIFPDIPVSEVVENGKKILNELHFYKNHPFLINCVPFEGDRKNAGCVLTFQNTRQIQYQEGKIRQRMHSANHAARYSFSDILYSSRIMKTIVQDAENFSYVDSNVLICGATGTGKELFAQSIHNSSSRKNNPFVTVNCSALSDTMLEAELFGYVGGAFSGASKSGRMGYFELAHTGTIFLDEVGDISPRLQGRLLRVLQEKEVMRVGSDNVIPVDVRIIAATNKNLRRAVAAGEFRQDLLYRLDVLELDLPMLKDRDSDVGMLMHHFIDFENERHGSGLKNFTKQAGLALASYTWPGNVRELRNFCERICILCKSDTAGINDVKRALPDIENASARRFGGASADAPAAVNAEGSSIYRSFESDRVPGAYAVSAEGKTSGNALPGYAADNVSVGASWQLPAGGARRAAEAAAYAYSGTSASAGTGNDAALRGSAEPEDTYGSAFNIPRIEGYDERTEIIKALSLYRNNRKKAAEHLGMHPSTLWRKMKKYGLS